MTNVRDKVGDKVTDKVTDKVGWHFGYQLSTHRLSTLFQLNTDY